MNNISIFSASVGFVANKVADERVMSSDIAIHGPNGDYISFNVVESIGEKGKNIWPCKIFADSGLMDRFCKCNISKGSVISVVGSATQYTYTDKKTGEEKPTLGINVKDFEISQGKKLREKAEGKAIDNSEVEPLGNLSHWR